MSKARELASLGNAYSDGALSNRNLIINGAMQVAQRGTSFASKGHTLDRWILSSSATAPTVTQETGVFSLGGKSIKMAPDATNTYAYVGQRIEDLSFFSGKTIAVSFDYKSTQDFYVGFEYHYGVGGSATDYNQNEVLVPAAATATRAVVTVTVPDLSAKTFGPSNTSFLQVFFNEVTNPSILEMTNVQLEVGDTATPFEHRSYGQELALCQRYYQRSVQTVGTTFGYGDGDVAAANCVNTNWLMDNLGFKVTMRAIPTFRNSGGAGTTGTVMRSSTGGNISLTLTCRTDGEVRGFPGGNVNAYESVQFSWDADAEL